MTPSGRSTTPTGRAPTPSWGSKAGLLAVLAGPSGVGKGTVVAALGRRLPEVWVSVSVTTRPPRPGEQAGEAYEFVTESEYDALVASGGLLEHARYAGHGYGTPAGPVRERLAAGQVVVLEIDVAGARQVRESEPGALLVFLAPPSESELRRRLVDRGTEGPHALARRLESAHAELAAIVEFDHVVINDEVERAADALLALIRAVRE